MEKQIDLDEGKHRVEITLANAKYLEILNSHSERIGNVASNRMSDTEIFHLHGGIYTLVTDGVIGDINAEPEKTDMLKSSMLILKSDANDIHIVDGIGEIPSDGVSYTTISVQKYGPDAKPATENSDNNELFIRTNAGTIKDESGVKKIRKLYLSNGTGKFRLYSEKNNRVATIQVISAIPDLEDASISIEFY